MRGINAKDFNSFPTSYFHFSWWWCLACSVQSGSQFCTWCEYVVTKSDCWKQHLCNKHGEIREQWATETSITNARPLRICNRSGQIFSTYWTICFGVLHNWWYKEVRLICVQYSLHLFACLFLSHVLTCRHDYRTII